MLPEYREDIAEEASHVSTAEVAPVDSFYDYPEYEAPPSAAPSSEEVGGCIWVVLFGLVMGLAVCANLALATALISSRHSRRDPSGILLMTLFTLAVLDYSALSFQFSLGVEQHFPFGSAACAAYQAVTKATPVTQSAALILMLWYGVRGSIKVNPFTGVLIPLAIVFAAAALPNILLAAELQSDDRQYCDLALSGIAASVYHLTYSAGLTFWIPFLVRRRMP